jgi:hypothetical protein
MNILMPKRFTQLFTGVFLLIAVAVGGAYGKKPPKEPPQPTIVKLNAEVPSLAALEDTPQSQTKGGLRITLAPETYEAKESWTVQSQQIAPHGWLVVQPSPNAVYVQQTKVPSLTVSPDHLVFHMHLNNQMPHVFRGSGIAVQFNVAGKVVSADASGYGDLTNIILPPRSEQEVAIVGPEISTIKSPCTVGVFLFDVVTNIDQAGNVTAKQNYEWYFSYQTQAVEKEFSVPPPQEGWVVPQ